MRCTKLALFLLVLPLTLVSNAGRAQSPTPIVVQAASPAAATSTTTTVATKEADPVQAEIKTLQQMKAANDEILSKQKAALERLDELQQAADQLKIFSKRG